MRGVAAFDDSQFLFTSLRREFGCCLMKAGFGFSVAV